MGVGQAHGQVSIDTARAEVCERCEDPPKAKGTGEGVGREFNRRPSRGEVQQALEETADWKIYQESFQGTFFPSLLSGKDVMALCTAQTILIIPY